MRITYLMALLLISPLTLAVEWCNDKGECFTQEPLTRLLQVPANWKPANVVHYVDGAKGIRKDKGESCTGCLVVGPTTVDEKD